MFGLTTPVTCSSRLQDRGVVERARWLTQPPAVHGETMMQGTRKPRADRVAARRTVMNSPGVPAGAVGGGHVVEVARRSRRRLRMNTVLAHTSGLAAIASILLATKSAPAAGM